MWQPSRNVATITQYGNQHAVYRPTCATQCGNQHAIWQPSRKVATNMHYGDHHAKWQPSRNVATITHNLNSYPDVKTLSHYHGT
jgi:hypothetical protein